MAKLKFTQSVCGQCGAVNEFPMTRTGGFTYICSVCDTLMYQPNEWGKAATEFHAYMNSRNPNWPAHLDALEEVAAEEEKPARLPRRAKYGSRILDVLHYEGEGVFALLDGNAQITVHRDRLTFIKG